MANGKTFSGGGLTAKLPRPPPTTQTDDVKRQQEEFQRMARDAGEAFQSLVISRDNQIRGGGAPGRFFVLLEKEFIEAAKIWKEALKFAGKDTSVVDRSLARALDGTPKVPITFTTIKAGERRLIEQGGVSQVAVPASEIIPQGAVQSIGGVPGVRGQPAPGPAPKIKAVFDTTIKQPRFASEEEILGSNGVLQPLPTGFEIKTNPDGSVTILSGTRRGEDKEGKSRERLVSIQNMARRALSLIDVVEKGGADVLATSGFLSQLKSGFDAQAKSIAKKFGLSLNTESFDFPGLNEDAVNARLIKSAVLDLAIMKAQAIGLGSGRALSDKDIQQQINTLSGGFGDPNVVIANIKQAVANVALDFQQGRRILFDEPTFDIRSNLGPGSEVFFNEQEVNAPQGATRIEDLPDGTVVVQNGIRFVIQDGQAVPQ